MIPPRTTCRKHAQGTVSVQSIVIWTGTSSSHFPETSRQSGFWHSVCGCIPGRCDRHRMDEGRAQSQAGPRCTERVWFETASRQVWVLPTPGHIHGTRDLSRWSETIRRTRRRHRQDSHARERQTAGKLNRQTELLRKVPTVVLNHLCPSKPTAQTGRWVGLVRWLRSGIQPTEDDARPEDALGSLWSNKANHSGSRCIIVRHRRCHFSVCSRWHGGTNCFRLQNADLDWEELQPGGEGGPVNHFWCEEIPPILEWTSLPARHRSQTSSGQIESREESTGDDTTATTAMGADNDGLRLPQRLQKVCWSRQCRCSISPAHRLRSEFLQRREHSRNW